MAQGWIERDPAEWTAQAFQDLAGEKEGLHLEFKKAQEFLAGEAANRAISKDKLREQLAETASAFLNSDGGLILLGVQTERTAGRRKDETLSDPSKWLASQMLEGLRVQLSDKQLLDLIHSNVSPRPERVRVGVVEVPVEGTTTSVFVIHIPASEVGAHQSLVTKRYYRRFDSGDFQMADHEIRDVNARRAAPRLRATIYVASAMDGRSDWGSDSRASSTGGHDPAQRGAAELRIGALLGNHGRGTAHDARLDIGLPGDFAIRQRLPTEAGGATARLNRLLDSRLGSSVYVVFGAVADPPVPVGMRGTARIEDVQWISVTYSGSAPGGHPLWGTPDLETDLVPLTVARPRSGDPLTRWIPWRVLTEGTFEARGVAALSQNPPEFVTDRPYWVFRIENCSDIDALWAGERETSRYQQLLHDMGLDPQTEPGRVR